MSEVSNERCPGYSEFIDVTAQLGSIYLAKNHDYGNSFEKGMDTMGDVYAISRIFDKTNRLVELSKKDVVSKVPEETILYRKKGQKLRKYGLYIHTTKGNTFVLLNDELKTIKSTDLDEMVCLTEEKGKTIFKL